MISYYTYVRVNQISDNSTSVSFNNAFFVAFNLESEIKIKLLHKNLNDQTLFMELLNLWGVWTVCWSVCVVKRVKCCRTISLKAISSNDEYLP